MTIWGADALALEDLGHRLDQAAAMLESIGISLRSQLMSSPWEGSDAMAFRNEWDDLHRRSVVIAAQFLREGGRRLCSNATEQLGASSDHGGHLMLSGGTRTVAGDETQLLQSDARELAADVMRNLAGDRQFKITAVEGHPPTLLVRLPGVQDLTSSGQAGVRLAKQGAMLGAVSSPLGAAGGAVTGFALGFVGEAAHSDGNVRDLSSAFWQNLWHKGDYANVVTAEVSEYRLTHGITETPNIVLVGHSYGAMTALDLAADHTFNGVVGHVTHVIAAGGGQAGRIDDVLPGTKVMVMTNTGDVVNGTIHLSQPGRTEAVPGRFEEQFASTGNYWKDVGHDNHRYADHLLVAGGPADDFVSEAFEKFAGQKAVTTSLSTVVQRH